ncbi:putative scaffolding protein [Vibrio phage 434O48-1]|nr:putative scaffolding protein [Vibrio phage 434O48-1]
MFTLEKLFAAMKMQEADTGDQGGGGGGGDADTPPPATPPAGDDNTPPAEEETPPSADDVPPPAGDRPEWLPESFDNPEDFAKSHAEMMEKLGGFTGSPETGEYNLTLGEGQEGFEFYEHEKGDIKSFMNLAKELNMSQQSFDKVLQLYVDSKIVQDEQNLVQRQAATLQMVGGEKEMATINAKAKAQLTPEQFKMLQHATSTAPDAAGAAILLVNSLALGGESKPITSFTTPPALKTKGELREMMKDPRYKTDAGYRSEILQGFEALEKQRG